MTRIVVLLSLLLASSPGLALALEDEERLMSIDERELSPAPAEPEARPPLIPMPRLEPAIEEAFWGLFDDLVPGLPSPRRSWPARFAILALLAAIAYALGRARALLPRAGALPRVSGLAHLLARVALFVGALVVASHLVPAEMMPVVFMVLVAMAAAIGWSMRDFFPDVVAGMVLLFEARMKPGVWVSGEGFAGYVERVGVRATWLRDVHGHRESIPNRRVITSKLLLEGGAMQEVRLRIEADASAGEIRAAIRDASLASPWTLAHPPPVVLRDPAGEHAWLVRARLMHQKYAGRFEGELLERTEEMLEARREPRRAEDEPAG